MTSHQTYRGYSLLELIVSLGLFSVVMLIVLVAYVNLISLDRQARANNQLSSSLSFAIETMARSMRTGTSYACNANPSAANCATGGSSVSFVDSESVYTRYQLVTNAQGNGSIGYCTGACTTVTPITDQRIHIATLLFYVQGVGTTPATRNLQPQITVSIAGTMKTDAGESVDFSIQTGATQRLIEI